MKIAVLSGKGGAGKTFVAVNLAVTDQQAVYIDCDVEEPNGYLFLQPDKVQTTPVTTPLPIFSEDKCIGCRKCVDFCRFNALVYIKQKPKVFSDICHSCGGCMLVCPTGAVTETPRPVGALECGVRNNVTVVTGKMALGEASATPVIRAALAKGVQTDKDVFIDCPPGSGCAVMESVREANYCILVAEPTAFGLHNLAMVQELVQLLQKPCGIIINKARGDYQPLLDFCHQHDLRILASFPYRTDIAALNAKADVACEKDESSKQQFATLLSTLRTEVEA